MHDAAVAWAEAVLGDPVREVAPLAGGVTSSMLALTTRQGQEAVLRLMTNEPWRTHGAELTRREAEAQRELVSSAVPVPRSLALDADGDHCDVPAHLMTRLPGSGIDHLDDGHLGAMVDVLLTIHAFRPAVPFRSYQSWAWPGKRYVPDWTRHPESWAAACADLDAEPPSYEPTFLHRDYSHRNLLWSGGVVCGVVDWVETSTGPAWLDAAHAATNLAMAFGTEPACAFVTAYAEASGTTPDPYWLLMDAVGFLPPPGQQPMFASEPALRGIDAWLHHLVTGATE